MTTTTKRKTIPAAAAQPHEAETASAILDELRAQRRTPDAHTAAALAAMIHRATRAAELAAADVAACETRHGDALLESTEAASQAERAVAAARRSVAEARAVLDRLTTEHAAAVAREREQVIRDAGAAYRETVDAALTAAARYEMAAAECAAALAIMAAVEPARRQLRAAIDAEHRRGNHSDQWRHETVGAYSVDTSGVRVGKQGYLVDLVQLPSTVPGTKHWGTIGHPVSDAPVRAADVQRSTEPQRPIVQNAATEQGIGARPYDPARDGQGFAGLTGPLSSYTARAEARERAQREQREQQDADRTTT